MCSLKRGYGAQYESYLLSVKERYHNKELTILTKLFSLLFSLLLRFSWQFGFCEVHLFTSSSVIKFEAN